MSQNNEVESLFYNYPNAKVDRIIDADTVVLEVDLGLDTIKRENLRIYGIDAPETYRPSTLAERLHGLAAKDITTTALSSGIVRVSTSKSRKAYGRYEAIIETEVGSITELLKEAGMEKLPNYDTYVIKEEFINLPVPLTLSRIIPGMKCVIGDYVAYYTDEGKICAFLDTNSFNGRWTRVVYYEGVIYTVDTNPGKDLIRKVSSYV